MGLNAYLYLRDTTYIDYEAKKQYPQNVLELLNADDDCSVIVAKRYQVGNFKKFHALHNYMIENCIDGSDDCKPTTISIDTIDALHEIFEVIIKDNSKAKVLLPTTCDTQEYDEDYFQDIKKAYELFTKIKAFLSDENNRDFELVYEAS